MQKFKECLFFGAPLCRHSRSGSATRQSALRPTSSSRSSLASCWSVGLASKASSARLRTGAPGGAGALNHRQIRQDDDFGAETMAVTIGFGLLLFQAARCVRCAEWLIATRTSPPQRDAWGCPGRNVAKGLASRRVELVGCSTQRARPGQRAKSDVRSVAFAAYKA